MVFIIETMCVYCAVGTEFSNVISAFRSQAIPCEISDGQRGIGTSFSPSTAVFPFAFNPYSVAIFTFSLAVDSRRTAPPCSTSKHVMLSRKPRNTDKDSGAVVSSRFLLRLPKLHFASNVPLPAEDEAYSGNFQSHRVFCFPLTNVVSPTNAPPSSPSPFKGLTSSEVCV